MKTVTAVIVLFGVLLPFGNPGWAGTGTPSATRYQYRQPTEAERLAKQQRDQAQQAQAQSNQSAAGAPGPVGTAGPGSGQNAKSNAVHR